MNRLFVRLVASSLVTVTFGAGVALADNAATIELTGPGSTNLVTNRGFDTFTRNVHNNVAVSNRNHQFARSGSVNIFGNTKVCGGSFGSGNARNTNFGVNHVNISNFGGFGGFSNFGNSGVGRGVIFLTGPDSFNRISSNNSRSFSSTIRNNVSANNFNTQRAESGNVIIRGNTLVTGVGGSGNASNFNQGVNDVNITNSQPFVGLGSHGGGGSAVISTTGPDSFNAISGNNSSRTNLSTVNNVTATNSNNQTARTGDVVISHNTVVSGVGGSGDATNWNSGMNSVDLSNR